MSAQAQTSSPVALVVKRTFKAPRERIFRAWTSAPELSAWFAPSDDFMIAADTDLQVGGSYRIEMRHVSGQVHIVRGSYREIDAPNKLVYTWRWEGAPTDTLVTVEFRPKGDATEITLTHEMLPSDEERAKHEQGWNGCMARLARFLDTGNASGGVEASGRGPCGE